ncbi:substrate-binding domain-containing protein [Microbacterium sp.]|uniref:substrate-binding domain-containing protein n=1 Tax=Microbacterium sp. TaxID=51671 RepID=UPI003C760F94
MSQKALNRISTRTVGVLASVAAASMLLAGCSAPAEPSTTSSEDGSFTVLLALSTLDNPYFITLEEGAQAAADEAGITLETVDAQNDPATQANQLADAITQEYDLVIINSVDQDAAINPVADLVAAGIPVIAVDNTVNTDQLTTTVASDNVLGGEMAAEALGAAVGESGQVAILRGLSGDSSSVARYEGFTTGIEKFADIEVVATQTADYDRALGLDVTTNILQANPDVVGIFAENDEMALGAIEALGDRAGTEVFVVGFDGTDDGIAAIKAGTLYASIAQQAALLGQTAVEEALTVLGGDTIDDHISVPVELLTAD